MAVPAGSCHTPHQEAELDSVPGDSLIHIAALQTAAAAAAAAAAPVQSEGRSYRVDCYAGEQIAAVVAAAVAAEPDSAQAAT